MALSNTNKLGCLKCNCFLQHCSAGVFNVALCPTNENNEDLNEFCLLWHSRDVPNQCQTVIFTNKPWNWKNAKKSLEWQLQKSSWTVCVLNCKKVRKGENSDVFSKKPPKFSRELSFTVEGTSRMMTDESTDRKVFYHLGKSQEEDEDFLWKQKWKIWRMMTLNVLKLPNNFAKKCIMKLIKNRISFRLTFRNNSRLQFARKYESLLDGFSRFAVGPWAFELHTKPKFHLLSIKELLSWKVPENTKPNMYTFNAENIWFRFWTTFPRLVHCGKYLSEKKLFLYLFISCPVINFKLPFTTTFLFNYYIL